MNRTPIIPILALAALAAPAPADTITVNFDFYPGPDNLLGTPDDIPITAPTLFSAQTEQLTDQFAAVGLIFRPSPPVNDRNEILDNGSFTVPAGATEPNLLASSGAAAIEGAFTVPVFRVGAILGISGGADRLEIYDSSNNLLGSVIGDDTFQSLSSPTPIARFVIVASSGSTATIDNLTFETGSTPCYANCDGSTTPPILNVNDFICFQSLFAAQDIRANCDDSSTPPILNVVDFVCFQTKYAQGCP